ncbi:hypothetical protein HZQ75_10920 [Elizabethkingia anophelis]|uniref:Uncharacterized protein n=2 Tax=Elizabethkingia anophelis TaxID=1117645 RepID=A0ABM6MP11_9FLAO|nr:hypothetical protein [Elizabethkingia anophelis]ATC34769.1 hypothetical protein BAZ09_000560 [Elizabethkingia anophelis R26]ATC38411.1 hypothetical protein EAAG1_000560 [Elizabethkingia anophelis Ag1]ATC42091.1 hypothetical protein CMV41_00560 [Elizabethkingia anophelis]ATC45767.1 hypothetical protein CMV40_00560 [Elizabethkingia anophelis]ELR78586.1 hypothetical protein D505_14887 [Elizabethkingia anophelis R26]
MKKEKSIENLSEKLKLGGFTKTFGSKIIGGNRTMTIKEVVISAPKPSLDSEYDDDGEDGDKPEDPSGPGKNTGPWY